MILEHVHHNSNMFNTKNIGYIIIRIKMDPIEQKLNVEYHPQKLVYFELYDKKQRP